MSVLEFVGICDGRVAIGVSTIGRWYTFKESTHLLSPSRGGG